VLRAMSSHVEKLEAQMKEAKTQAKIVAQQIRSQRKCCQARMRRGESQMLHLRAVGLRILAIALDAMQALEQWLLVKLPGADLTERTTMHAAITDEFIAMPVHRINVMLEPVAKRDISLLKEANQEVAKCDLHLWVCQQNLEKGLAPSVGAIMQQKNRRESVASTYAEQEDKRAPGRSAAYKWIGRWTRRWRMPKSKIQDRDMLSASVLRRKVTVD